MESNTMKVILNPRSQELSYALNETAMRLIAPCQNRRRCIGDEIATGLAYAAMIILWTMMFHISGNGQARPESINHQDVLTYPKATQSLGFPRILAQ